MHGTLAARTGRTRPAALAALAIWILIAALLSEYPLASGQWTASFLLLTVGSALSIRAFPDAVRPLLIVWASLAVGVSLFAVTESFLLHANPLLGPFYESPPAASRPIAQVWSVYRATTTLGHPLVNGLFLAVSVPICLQLVVRERSVLSVAMLLALMAGLIATGSRGAVVAAAVGAGGVFLVEWFSGSQKSGLSPLRLVGALLATAALIYASSGSLLRARGESEEGQISANYRQQSTQRGIALIGQDPVLGVGPGGAYLAAAGQQSATRGGALENTWLEWSVALGLPGLMLVLWVVGDACRRAMRVRDGALLGALLAYFIAASGFNWLEAYTPGHLVLGLLLGWAYGVSTLGPDFKAEET